MIFLLIIAVKSIETRIDYLEIEIRRLMDGNNNRREDERNEI